MTFEHPGKAQIPQLVKLWKEVFGEYDGFWELFLDTAFSPDHCRCIAEDGQVIAGLYWFDCSCERDRIAYIYAVVTDPQHRGKGLCRKLMADVHALLQSRGYDSVMLVPANEGLREMYRKMGYEDCTTISSLSCDAGNSPVQIRNVSAEEYAALRRKLLPEKAVLQEGVQLPFLAAQAQLFTGNDFLLAAWLDGEKLHGMELLGNTAAAPGILRALGCAKGVFQIPGNAKPFAMIHKLQEDAIIPNYLGFSFD
jgi:ribosomal protein S18 acetylase RimI-like enzyme